jgi:hypothetical protein
MMNREAYIYVFVLCFYILPIATACIMAFVLYAIEEIKDIKRIKKVRTNENYQSYSG